MKGNGRVFQRGQVWWIAYYKLEKIVSLVTSATALLSILLTRLLALHVFHRAGRHIVDFHKT